MKICANSKLQTSDTELRNVTPNRIAIHLGPDLSIWITLLHPYVSYCLIVLVVLALTYALLLLYPSLYCLTLVPFQMYLVMTLLTHLMFCLTWNYKVPVSCNYSTVQISKLSGSIPCTIKTCRHSASCIPVLLLLLLTSLTLTFNPKPQTYIQNT